MQSDFKSGIVYLMKCGKHYKIGITGTNIDSRLSSIQTSNPIRVDLICSASISNYKMIEKILHHIFMPKRHRREWFNLNEKDVDFIRTLLLDGFRVIDNIIEYYENISFNKKSHYLDYIPLQSWCGINKIINKSGWNKWYGVNEFQTS